MSKPTDGKWEAGETMSSLELAKKLASDNGRPWEEMGEPERETFKDAARRILGVV